MSFIKQLYMKLLFITLLLFQLLFSCKKYQPPEINCSLTNEIDSIKKFLPGTWVWLHEKRFNRREQKYEYLTPKTEGYSLTLKFDGNKAYYYKNNRPDSVYYYDVVRENTIPGTYPGDSLPVVIFYTMNTGLRYDHFPVRICPSFMIMQYEFISSVVGDYTWRKQ